MVVYGNVHRMVLVALHQISVAGATEAARHSQRPEGGRQHFRQHWSLGWLCNSTGLWVGCVTTPQNPCTTRILWVCMGSKHLLGKTTPTKHLTWSIQLKSKAEHVQGKAFTAVICSKHEAVVRTPLVCLPASDEHIPAVVVARPRHGVPPSIQRLSTSSRTLIHP